MIIDERFGGGTTISYAVTDITEQRFKAPILRYHKYKFNMKFSASSAVETTNVDEGLDDALHPGQINASNNIFKEINSDYIFPPAMQLVDARLEQYFDKAFDNSLFVYENIFIVHKDSKIMYKRWEKPAEKTEEEILAEKENQVFKSDAELAIEAFEVSLKENAYDLVKRGFNWNNAELLYRKQVTKKDLGIKKKDTSKVKEKEKEKKEEKEADEDALLPLPSYRMRNICAFEIRKHRLILRGKSLQREVECPLHCNTRIKQLELRFHLRFECTNRRVQCRFEFCKALFPFFERENHEKNVCYNSVKRRQILAAAEDHASAANCDQCGLSIRVKEMEEHLKIECVHRLVSCTYSDCRIKYQQHLQDYHLKYECESQKLAKRFFLIARARERSQYQRNWCVEIPFYQSGQPISDEIDSGDEARSKAADNAQGNDSEESEDEPLFKRTIEQKILERVHREFAYAKSKYKEALDDSDDSAASI